MYQDVGSPLTGIAYSLSNLSIQIGDTIFKSKNSVIPKEGIRYLQLIKDTNSITILAHYKGPYGETGIVSSSFVAPPFLPKYIGPSDSYCDGSVNELDPYHYRYALKLNSNLYWVYSLERLKLDELRQILNETQAKPNFKSLENILKVKIKIVD